jgi:AraC-like DNA-binding protein
LRKSAVEFSRTASQRGNHGTWSAPIVDAFHLSLKLRDMSPMNAWLEGRHYLKPECKAGTFTFYNMNVESVFEMTSHQFDNVQMGFSRAALNAISEEQGRGKVEVLRLRSEESIDDPIIRNLGFCLLPAFEHPERANKLFIEHVALALLAHVLHDYSELPKVSLTVRGGLAPWQVRRAKDMLLARLDGELALEELARECGLSRSHFARAFKKTIGKPPHRWLIEQRLERAREMLLKSTLSLGEIADTCGFADQSHFTRAFSAATGVTPSEWRRSRQF